MQTDQPGGAKAQKTDRLARALRANLRRRKRRSGDTAHGPLAESGGNLAESQE